MEEEKLLQILGCFEELDEPYTLSLAEIQEIVPWVTEQDLTDLVNDGELMVDWSQDLGLLYWVDESD